MGAKALSSKPRAITPRALRYRQVRSAQASGRVWREKGCPYSRRTEMRAPVPKAPPTQLDRCTLPSQQISYFSQTEGQPGLNMSKKVRPAAPKEGKMLKSHPPMTHVTHLKRVSWYSHVKQHVMLGTDPQVLPDGAHLGANVFSQNVGSTRGGREQPCQD